MNHTVIISAVLILVAAIVSTGFVTIPSISINQKQLEDSLRRLSDVVKNDLFIKECKARKFPYFYRILPDQETIKAEDGSINDWKFLHESTGESLHESTESIETDTWIDKIFSTRLPCETAVTPYDANNIHYLVEDKGIRSTDRDIRLWFSRNDVKEILYILGRIRDTEDHSYIERLRLLLDQNDLARKIILIELKEDGILKSQNMKDGAKIKGKWWKETSNEDSSTMYFEMQLNTIKNISAFQLIAEQLIEDSDKKTTEMPPDKYYKIISRIGTRGPIPLDGELKTYEIAKHLDILHQYYEIDIYMHYGAYRKVVFLRKSEEIDKRHSIGTVSYIYRSLILGPINRLYFYYNNIGPCHLDNWRDVEICFRSTETRAYRLRKGAWFPLKESRDIVTAFTEVTVDIPSREAFVPVVLTVVSTALLCGWFMSIHSAQRKSNELLKTHNELLKTHNELLKTHNEELKTRNKSFHQYDGSILHEARGVIGSIKRICYGLSHDDEDTKRKFDRQFMILQARLKPTTDMFALKDTVRNAITEQGRAEFDLAGSIRQLIDDFCDTGYAKNLEFTNYLEKNRQPRIRCASPEGGVADGYFQQALTKFIENAVSFRSPEDSTIHISLNVEGSMAVIDIRNWGNPIPEGKDLFELGTTIRDELRGKDEDDDIHSGLGLYIAREIIEAYGGSCCLANVSNKPDSTKSEVTATIRLPCRLYL